MSRSIVVIAFSVILGFGGLLFLSGTASAGASGGDAVSSGPAAPSVRARTSGDSKPAGAAATPGIPHQDGSSVPIFKDPRTGAAIAPGTAARRLRGARRAVEREAVRYARSAMWNPTRYDGAYKRLQDFGNWYYGDLGPGGAALRAWVARQSIYYDRRSGKIIDDSAYAE
jgi:hypothetical protein